MWCGAWRASPEHLRARRDQARSARCASEFGETMAARAPARRRFTRMQGVGHRRAHSPNIQRELWMKFAMLAPVAGMTALTRGPIGHRARPTAQRRALLAAAVKETVAVGVALKTGLEPADGGKVIALIDALPKQMMASMAHDLLAGSRSRSTASRVRWHVSAPRWGCRRRPTPSSPRLLLPLPKASQVSDGRFRAATPATVQSRCIRPEDASRRIYAARVSGREQNGHGGGLRPACSGWRAK